jgi:hypothetical protein
MRMKEIRVSEIRQVKITLLHNGDRPASVACCGGWAKRSQGSRILSLNIEVELNARMTNRFLECLSCGERHFNLEIQSSGDVGPTMVTLFLNCRTENIECEFGPLLQRVLTLSGIASKSESNKTPSALMASHSALAAIPGKSRD